MSFPIIQHQSILQSDR